MKTLLKSHKLDGVCYDIRGPVLSEANRLEEDGHRILKLHIGNPGAFGFDTPDEMLQDLIKNLPEAQGYCDSRGLFAARKAVMHYTQQQHIPNITIDDIYMGNGVSELIVMAMQGLINDGDEFLIPTPDYPLWTAAVVLCGGKAVHYNCDEANDWQPDINDIQQKITPKTCGIVVINPNNPTGAVYNENSLKAIAELAEANNLVVCADEIYDKILYDDAVHLPMARYINQTLCISFGGLSKNYRAAGFRSGWMVISGNKHRCHDYIEGINILASMRLCANVPAQLAVQTALGGYQSINDLVLPKGRLRQQRDYAWQRLNAMPGVSCVKPKGAIYLFPRIDPAMYDIGDDDEQFILDLLVQEHVLLVHGRGFNLPTRDHLRMVFLPHLDVLEKALDSFERFLAGRRIVAG